MPDIHASISAHTLATRLATPAASLILDICTDDDFALDPRLVPTALRHAQIGLSRAPLSPDQRQRDIVVICQKIGKLSHGAAARLHVEGCAATILSGGMQGWYATGLPALPPAALPESGLWTLAPGPEAAFAHWLLLRFAPPCQSLPLVNASEQVAVVERFGATSIASAAALLHALALATPCLEKLALACTRQAKDTLASAALMAKCACDPRAGAPDAPALALLDVALSALRPEGAF